MATYAEHIAEQREMAFLKWQRSGYRDIAAHDEFLRLYLIAQKLALKESSK
jgi:hypothetical protein